MSITIICIYLGTCMYARPHGSRVRSLPFQPHPVFIYYIRLHIILLLIYQCIFFPYVLFALSPYRCISHIKTVLLLFLCYCRSVIFIFYFIFFFPIPSQFLLTRPDQQVVVVCGA